MNLQQARANPHRSLFRQFAESAAYALVFAVPAANLIGFLPAYGMKRHITHGSSICHHASRCLRLLLRCVVRGVCVKTLQEVSEPAIVNFTSHPDGWDSLPPTIATKMLRDIEKRANSTNPKYPVTIMDDDTINLRRTDNIQTFRNRMYEVLNDRKISLR